MYHNEEGKGIEKEYREQEPPTLCSEIDRTARANSEQSCGGSCSRVIRQTASQIKSNQIKSVAKPPVLMRSQQNCSKQEER